MRYILIHGAWSDCWSLLKKQLIDLQNTVACVELPQFHSPVLKSVDDVTYTRYMLLLEKTILNSPEPCVVVLHSMAGMMWPITEKYEDRIIHTFFLNAYAPMNGESVVEQARKYRNPESDPIVKKSSCGQVTYIIKEKAPYFFYNCCSSEIQKEMMARIVPQALAPMREKIFSAPRKDLSHKRTYIACSKDRMIPIAHQLIIAETIAKRILTLPHADHFPQLSQTQALAQLLTDPAIIGKRKSQIVSKL